MKAKCDEHQPTKSRSPAKNWTIPCGTGNSWQAWKSSKSFLGVSERFRFRLTWAQRFPATGQHDKMAAAGGGKDVLAAPPAVVSREKVLLEYPLHWHVWHHDASSLEEELVLNKVSFPGRVFIFLCSQSGGVNVLSVWCLQHDKEKQDRRGRTPLHFAVSLGYADCVKVLLRSGCDANALNAGGWNGTLAGKQKPLRQSHNEMLNFVRKTFEGFVYFIENERRIPRILRIENVFSKKCAEQATWLLTTLSIPQIKGL